MQRTARPLALLTLLPLALGTASADRPRPPQGTPEQVQTIHDLRNVGTAMYAWYRDEMASRPSPEESKAKAPEKPLADPQDMTAVPEISRDELAKILVPKYIAAIPENDPWGRPYEYRLNTKNLDAPHVMGLRSAGSDGNFDGSLYQIGSFASAETTQDIAWMDGFFVRWPEPPKP